MRAKLPLLLAPLVLAGCLGPQDLPSHVHDLRVLGVQLSPPELMAPTCGFSREALLVLGAEVQYTALIADPAGAGRRLRYQLFACASAPDRDCQQEELRFLLAEGEVAADPVRGWTELALTLRPALITLPDRERTLLLQKVVEEDPYQGLGGVRLPLVLHLQAGEEEIWAQKLMVYSCAFFPESAQNANPILPGVTLGGEPWGEGEVPTVSGPVQVKALDFSDREEDYVVPAFDLSKVQLRESWKIAWYTTLGSFSPGTTGGTNASGEESRPVSEWKPPRQAEEQDVQLWMVVRDGRGGLSWITRRLRYKPE